MSFAAVAGGLAASVGGFGLSKLFGGGGGGGGGGGFDLSSLAPYLSGALTSQRIPGQTTSGEYTPPAGGYGTYNYIPTGAGQVDPAVLNLLLGGGARTNQAIGTATGPNNDLLSGQLNNPLNANLLSGATAASSMANNASGLDQSLASQIQGGVSPLITAFQNVMGRAGSNPYMDAYLASTASAGQGQAGAGQALTSAAQGAIGGINNQFNPQQLAGAQTAGNMLQNTGAQTAALGNTFQGQVAAGLPAASQILNTAFDPQQQLYNRSQQQLNDQLGTYLARTGLTNSGAGAGIASDAFKNFDIDWQNQQLGRQTSGLNAYTSALTGAGANLGTGSNLQATGAGQVASGAALPAQTLNQQTGTTFNLAGQGAGALGQTFGLTQSGNSAGYNAYQGTTNDFANLASQSATGMGNLANASTGAGNLMNLGTNAAYSAGAIPYSAGQTIYGNQNSALGNFLSNQTSMGNLSNQNVTQLLNYLSGVNNSARTAGANAMGAQTGQSGANAGAAAGINPLISSLLGNGSGGGLSGLLSSIFGGGFNGGSDFSSLIPGGYFPTSAPSFAG